jgi:single-strand DNA-binding protein
MVGGKNIVILIGRLGTEPNVYMTSSGVTVATIYLETCDSWQDRQTGQWQEQTQWHPVIFFDRLANVVGRYLHQGSLIYIEAYLQTRQWQEFGQQHYLTEIIADKMQMLGRRGTKKSPSQSGGGYGTPLQSIPFNQQKGQANSSPNNQLTPSTWASETDDSTNDLEKYFDNDVPF